MTERGEKRFASNSNHWLSLNSPGTWQPNTTNNYKKENNKEQLSRNSETRKPTGESVPTVGTRSSMNRLL